MRHALIALILATSTFGPAAASRDATTAVAKAGRPTEAVALDAVRKPAQVLDFMKLKRGMRALDMLTGSGYYAEIMGRVVGPKGSVLAYVPAGPYGERSKPALAAIMARQPNVRMSNDIAATFMPASYDFVMIHLNYHDFYWQSEQFGIPRTDPNVVLGGLFRAVKPGGIVAVVDHIGKPGDTRAIVDSVHRIDPETVKADFARAGFVLDGSSDLLRNASDDLSKNVFDPAMRGNTDRMTLRFRKPK